MGVTVTDIIRNEYIRLTVQIDSLRQSETEYCDGLDFCGGEIMRKFLLPKRKTKEEVYRYIEG